jgi:hypothetical protein
MPPSHEWADFGQLSHRREARAATYPFRTQYFLAKPPIELLFLVLLPETKDAAPRLDHISNPKILWNGYDSLSFHQDWALEKDVYTDGVVCQI